MATSTKKPTTRKSRTAKPLSKKDQTVKIVNRMAGRKKSATRKQILGELQTKVGISAECAATYYQNIKLGRWS